MTVSNRREFLGQVGSGMLASALGFGVARELGLAGSVLADETGRLDFGPIEPLVATMQDTPADALLGKMKAELDKGTELRTLVAAAALANARTFGGQDYTGYHCFMALVPAFEMAKRLPGRAAALPVFKVLHRNARRIQEQGGSRNEVLAKLERSDRPGVDPAAKILAAGRSGDFDAAEASLATIASSDLRRAYGAIQPLVRDNIDVHQVVLAYRCWDMMRLAGENNGAVLLRQAMRQCVDRDENRRRRGRPEPSIRKLLPKLMEAHGLSREVAEISRLDSVQFDTLAHSLFAGDRDGSAKTVAALLAQGVSRHDIGEALSLASARLLLHDPGKSRAEKGKPKGSVHGASVGVHASDSANAWRGIAAETDPANSSASLVTAAWHTAGQSSGMNHSRPFHATARDAASKVRADQLLDAIDEAVRGRDQRAAAALTERYGKLGLDAEPLSSRLIEPAIRNDGALHHEKYFLTAHEEFARTRSEYRWEHLVSLARVMASGYGFEAPGIDESKRLLGA